MRFTPGWAVGWFFVPVMQLFRPYQVMAELWRRSAPTTGRELPDAPVSPVVGWWWAFWLAPLLPSVGVIVAGIVGVEPFASLLEPTTMDESRIWPLLSLVGGVSDGVAAVLAITVVRGLSARIEARARLVERREFAAL